MRAIVIDAPGDESVMRVGEVPAPDLGAGSLRIGVAATAVNRADLLQRRGLYPPPPGASEILGLECAGEVLEVASLNVIFPSASRVLMPCRASGPTTKTCAPDSTSCSVFHHVSGPFPMTTTRRFRRSR